MQPPRYFYPAALLLLAGLLAVEIWKAGSGRYIPGPFVPDRGDYVLDTRTGRMCSVLRDIAAYSYRSSGAGWCSKPFPAEAPREVLPQGRAP